jgi:secondary thiamine-phosphate synthase enzyme
MRTATFTLDTSSARILDVTATIADFVAGDDDGLVNVFLPHATAGLALFELGAGTDPDVLDAIDRLLPRDGRYRHRHGSPGHGADHVLPAFVSPSLTIPVGAGRLLLGTWQSIVVVDPNRDNPRRTLRCSFLAG